MNTTIDSPVGPLDIELRDDLLTGLRFSDRQPSAEAVAHPALDHLARYFAGDLDSLSGIDVDLRGTPFQLQVWNALRAVPPGEVASYSEIAAAVGHPKACRAVGQANHHNPVAIVVPCHRVVASGGGLGGYGGGLERKQWLLEHEGARPGTLALATATTLRTAS